MNTRVNFAFGNGKENLEKGDKYVFVVNKVNEVFAIDFRRTYSGHISRIMLLHCNEFSNSSGFIFSSNNLYLLIANCKCVFYLLCVNVSSKLIDTKIYEYKIIKWNAHDHKCLAEKNETFVPEKSSLRVFVDRMMVSPK